MYEVKDARDPTIVENEGKYTVECDTNDGAGAATEITQCRRHDEPAQHCPVIKYPQLCGHYAADSPSDNSSDTAYDCPHGPTSGAS
jgi:hypothetical protein